MLGTIPIWVAVLSHLSGAEKMSRFKAVGVALAFTGVLLILAGQAGADQSEQRDLHRRFTYAGRSLRVRLLHRNVKRVPELLSAHYSSPPCL